MQWYNDDHDCPEHLEEGLHVRMFSSFFDESPLHQKMEVILDSGANVSLIILKEGRPLRNTNNGKAGFLQDAQGNCVEELVFVCLP